MHTHTARFCFSPYQGKCVPAYCSTDSRPLMENFLPEAQQGFHANQETRDDISQFQKSLQQYELNAMGHPIETRVPWPLCQVHICLTSRNEDIRELSETFKVENRVKYNCLLAPILFPIFLSMVLFDAFTGSPNVYRVDLGTNLFNSQSI